MMEEDMYVMIIMGLITVIGFALVTIKSLTDDLLKEINVMREGREVRAKTDELIKLLKESE